MNGAPSKFNCYTENSAQATNLLTAAGLPAAKCNNKSAYEKLYS